MILKVILINDCFDLQNLKSAGKFENILLKAFSSDIHQIMKRRIMVEIEFKLIPARNL